MASLRNNLRFIWVLTYFLVGSCGCKPNLARKIPHDFEYADPPGNDDNLDEGSPANVFEELEKARTALGKDAEILRDGSGAVIGLAVREPDPYKPAGEEISGKDDSSICCRTREAFFFNTTLNDYHGTRYTIAQKAHIQTYQFIRHGLCTGYTGSCPGVCEQKYVTVSLLVHPTTQGRQATFQFFKVPGYCACRVPKILKAVQVDKSNLKPQATKDRKPEKDYKKNKSKFR